MLEGAMFLPDEVMIISFLRSTTLRKPSSSMLADVAGVHPALVVDQLRAGLGVLVVAAGVDRAAGQDLAVVGDRDLDAGLGAADGAEPEVPADRRR